MEAPFLLIHVVTCVIFSLIVYPVYSHDLVIDPYSLSEKHTESMEEAREIKPEPSCPRTLQQLQPQSQSITGAILNYM